VLYVELMSFSAVYGDKVILGALRRFVRKRFLMVKEKRRVICVF
jgi:hypothetical protein